MELPIIYEDQDVLVVNKPAGIIFYELIEPLLPKYPGLKNVGEAPRYGIVHRLDKDTSGLVLVAKTPEALIFLQKQFKNREVEKKCVALATGVIKTDSGTITTFIGRSPRDHRKQVVLETGEREAITEYTVLQRFAATPKAGEPRPDGREKYTLIDVNIKTGRKHQIRCHLAHIHHPIAGDALYGFKDSPKPEGLHRQFLHASYIKIALPNNGIQEFHAPLPQELENVLKQLT